MPIKRLACQRVGRCVAAAALSARRAMSHSRLYTVKMQPRRSAKTRRHRNVGYQLNIETQKLVHLNVV